MSCCLESKAYVVSCLMRLFNGGLVRISGCLAEVRITNCIPPVRLSDYQQEQLKNFIMQPIVSYN